MSSNHKQRGFLVRSLAAVSVAAALSACVRDRTSGPVDIDWGQERDARCNMMVDNPRFAAEVRDPGGKLWKFDDIGCAVIWLEQHGLAGATPGLEVWVKDFETGEWLDARQVRYVHGVKSPMRYQYGATGKVSGDGVAYDEMRRAVLASGR
ncbi:MAG: protein NosL [Actinomycetota bacterium]